METKEEATQKQEALVEFETTQRNIFALSQDKQREFYLKEAVLLSPERCSHGQTDYEMLIVLLKEYQKINTFLSQLNSFQWELCIPNLHEICIPYLLEDKVSLKKRRNVSDQISTHIRFLTVIVSNRHIAKELYGYYNQGLNNLKRLLKEYPEHKKQ